MTNRTACGWPIYGRSRRKRSAQPHFSRVRRGTGCREARARQCRELYAAAMTAYDQLYDGSTSAETTLRAALKSVEEIAKYDARFVESVQQLQSARAIVEDVSATARDFAEHTQASPDRLEVLEDRLALIDKLKRKYGTTLDEVIAYGRSRRGSWTRSRIASIIWPSSKGSLSRQRRPTAQLRRS